MKKKLPFLGIFYWTRVRSLAMFVDCRLVNLIDVTLAREDAYSKLAEVVTVADVDDENRLEAEV